MIYSLACFALLAFSTPAEIAISKQCFSKSEIALKNPPSSKEELAQEEIEAQKTRQMLNKMPFRSINQLNEVLAAGLVIVFKDLSKWEIERKYIIYTSAWLIPVKIKLERVDDPDNYEFPFTMTNIATKKSVSARRIE